MSKNYTKWVTRLDPKVCLLCAMNHGKIYKTKETPYSEIPHHIACRCEFQPTGAIVAGNATKEGQQGADWYLKYTGHLPSYYIGQKEMEILGWHDGDKPAKFAPGKMLTKGVYGNLDGKLPQKPGRVWYEADINYYSGVRNQHCIFWSNDGLIFVTYNHGLDFYEII